MKQGESLTGRLKRIALLSAPPKGLLANNALELRALNERARTRALSFVRAPQPKVYGAIGDLEVRLGASRHDLLQAQRLRYEVFYEDYETREGEDVYVRTQRIVNRLLLGRITTSQILEIGTEMLDASLFDPEALGTP